MIRTIGCIEHSSLLAILPAPEGRPEQTLLLAAMKKSRTAIRERTCVLNT